MSAAGRATTKVANVASKTSFHSALTFPAPSAGTIDFELDFFKQPTPAGVEFPPPDALDVATIQVAARYAVSLDAINVKGTRAPIEDRDYASLSASTGDQARTAEPTLVGDVKSGQHAVGLTVGPFDIVPGGPDLVISFVVVNKGHGSLAKTTIDVLNGISAATREILNAVYPAYAGVWKAADAITQKINALFDVNCDGIVVADKIAISSSSLNQMTGSSQRYTETRQYPGTDSPVGCGSNSSYDATFSIQRIAHD